jgi:amphi-Trp domain-containing protein
MTELKFERRTTVSRADAAALLAEIAQALASEGEFKLERDGQKLELSVAAELRMEFEVEIEDGETEIEIELKWSSASPSPSPAPAPPRPPRTKAAGRSSKRAKRSGK